MEFKDRLRQIMETNRWNSKQLAEAAGLCPTAISHFINGRRKPSLDTFKKLCEAMGVEADVLLDYDIEEKGWAG